MMLSPMRVHSTVGYVNAIVILTSSTMSSQRGLGFVQQLAWSENGGKGIFGLARQLKLILMVAIA